MSIKKIFKHRLSHAVYLFKNGKAAYFVDNKFMTEDPKEIVELAEEVKSGHPQIYIDPLEAEIDTTLQDKIIEAQTAATLAVLAEHNAAKQDAVGKPDNLAERQNTMSAATLLNVTSSGGALASLAALSNTK